MSNEWKQNIKNTRSWTHGLYVLIVLAIGSVASFIIFLIAIYQFISMLLTHKANERLSALGWSLGEYLKQVATYVTCHSEERPFPFGEWPKSGGTPSDSSGSHHEASHRGTHSHSPDKDHPTSSRY